jgi:nucleotide-binding universal stress UspA family protein
MRSPSFRTSESSPRPYPPAAAAEKFAPRFLVIGSNGWGAVKRALFGSVSTGVLHHVTCPVLVVAATEVAATNGHVPAEKAHA